MKMSTSQKAVMLCACSSAVEAGMACLQAKLCLAISEHFEKCNSHLKALYECPRLLYFFNFTFNHGA